MIMGLVLEKIRRKMKTRTLFAITCLVVSCSATEIVHAAPQFQIVGAGGIPPTNQESIGDQGGTGFPAAGNAGAVGGAGMPTINGGWPNSANFSFDSGFPAGCTPGVNCAIGI